MDLKKGVINMNMLIGLILVVVFLVLAIVFINQYRDNYYDYQNSLIACNRFISSVDGDEIYFDKLNLPTTAFERSFSNLCPSRSDSIDSNSVKSVVDLADDCWSKFDNGREFIGPYMVDTKLCFYCGEVVAKNDIVNFGKKFDEVVKNGNYDFDESLADNNLNELYLSESFLPNLKQDDELSVFYVIYKDPDFKKNNNFLLNLYNDYKMKVEGAISDSGGWLGMLTNYMADSDNVDVHSGVLITKNYDNLTQLGCDTYIPIKNYG